MEYTICSLVILSHQLLHLFLSGFQVKIVCAFFISPMYGENKLVTIEVLSLELCLTAAQKNW